MENDWKHQTSNLPKEEKGGVTSPFTAAGQAPDWRNPGKNLPFDTLDPVIPSVGDLYARVRGILNAAESWTRGWIAGDSSGVSQDLCQAVLAYWKYMGIDPPLGPVDRTQSPDAMRYEIQQKYIAHLNLQLDGELKRHRVSVDRLREIKRIVQDV